MKRADAGQSDRSDKIVLSTPATHSDSMWRNETRVGHGGSSVKCILHRCKEVRCQRVYCGLSNYSHICSKGVWDGPFS